MKVYERRAFVRVTADDEQHARAMFAAIDGADFDTHSEVPGYAAHVHLDDGEMEEVDEDELPDPPALTLVTPPLRIA